MLVGMQPVLLADPAFDTTRSDYDVDDMPEDAQLGNPGGVLGVNGFAY